MKILNLFVKPANELGVQCVVVAIDAKKRADHRGYDVYIKGGRENAGLDLVDWAKKCERLGAGEILLTSMDKDGTKTGYDLEMLNDVCTAVNIPVVASGGCGKISDIVEVFQNTRSDAALVASLFHYGEATVDEVKDELIKNNIPARIIKKETL